MDEQTGNAPLLEGYCQVAPYENFANIDSNPGYVKMDVAPRALSQISAMLRQNAVSSLGDTLANAYVVTFPAGLPQALTPLKQGGYSTALLKDGRWAGSASLYPLADVAVLVDALNALSFATGQYFLTQINSELDIIKLALDSVLKFLYGDKKAELMSEVSFVQYAYKNYAYIMGQETQRLATIVSLQESRKVAMKDIEFYIGDLAAVVDMTAGADIVSMVDKAFQIKESLDTAMQLYVSSGILEAYYAQNFDAAYIGNVESTMTAYISKCEKQMLSSFGVLCGFVHAYKPVPLKKVPIEELRQRADSAMTELKNIEESPLRVSLRSALHAEVKKTEYVIGANGVTYLKIS